MAKKKTEDIEVKEEVVTEEVKEEVAEPKPTIKVKNKRQIFIENRLAAINRIHDEGKAKRAATALFRKGN